MNENSNIGDNYFIHHIEMYFWVWPQEVVLVMVMESGNLVNICRVQNSHFTVDVLILVISIEMTTLGKLWP